MIKIPRYPIKYYCAQDINNDDCLICMDKIMGDNDHNRILECSKCGIIFHFDCIIAWLYSRDINANKQCCHCRCEWSTTLGYIKLA
jgi:hypothetical protein